MATPVVLMPPPATPPPRAAATMPEPYEAAGTAAPTGACPGALGAEGESKRRRKTVAYDDFDQLQKEVQSLRAQLAAQVEVVKELLGDRVRITRLEAMAYCVQSSSSLNVHSPRKPCELHSQPAAGYKCRRSQLIYGGTAICYGAVRSGRHGYPI
eukprot:3919815-Pleurochrysis_carterae.AAC.1